MEKWIVENLTHVICLCLIKKNSSYENNKNDQIYKNEYSAKH